MNTPSSDADDGPTQAAPDEVEGINPWVVRFFLILAFGLAFGIEGMTLIRSFLLGEDEDAEEQVEAEERGEIEEPEAAPVHIGDDLLPATAVSERVAEMKIWGRSDGPWVFRLVVTVTNDGKNAYRLSLRNLEVDDGTEFDDVHAAECPPGDSTQLVASWPIGTDARPRALTAEATLQGTNDSTRTVRRRVTFGHVPVQMKR
ncbi:MAG: hypothetical protein ABEL04_11415 [Salinibacter sp.]|uniref:hypothetical protein n=1 Tax=Salinibacter sp. TaxID=2065818 RepID=UPI0035D4964D